MKLIRLLCRTLGCILLATHLHAQSATTNTLPSYLVKFAPESIRADGKLDEAAWSASPWSRDYVWIDAGDPAPLKAHFKAVYNSEGLHLAFEFESIRTPGQPLDPTMPYACEVFLDPEGRGRRYLEYAVAPDGAEHAVAWDGRVSMAQWKGEPGVASRSGVSRSTVDAKRETVLYEVTLPWVSVAKVAGRHRFPPARGEAWRANFSRVESGEAVGDFSWAPMGGIDSMHNPGCFGWLVFAGEIDPLNDLSAVPLKPLEDVSLQIAGSRRFPLFSRTPWARSVIEPKSDVGTLLVGKTFVARLDANGRTEWRLSRTEGLPQFIRSTAWVEDRLYVIGTGMNAGLVTVDGGGRLNRNAKGEGYVLDLSASLVSLAPQKAVAISGDRFQLITGERIHAPAQASGKVQCVVALGNDRLAVGTPNGFEISDGNGRQLQRAAIAGGIIDAVVMGDSAIGVSGKSGLYRLTSEGACRYFPAPLRTKFERVFADSTGRCWATYAGGIASVTGDRVQHFTEPRATEGFQVLDAAPTRDGKMVFAGRVSNGSGYGSVADSSFLLVSDGKRWWKYGLGNGLPAQVNSIRTVNGEIFLCTNAGVFRFRP